MTNVVEIDGLEIEFRTDGGTEKAVDAVSFVLRKGEILAIVGESGSGKTLIARSILGLLPETASVTGSIKIKGKQVVGANHKELRAIRGRDAAMVFQEPSTALNPVFSVGWQIGEGLRAHGMANAAQRRRKAIDLLRAVGIPDPERRIDQFPHQFSGGQKQRIVIAMALALNPAVIIADEPTTALDVTIQAEILNLLRYCRDELGSSIIMITHNMGIVADLSDRVMVIYQGKLIEQATVDNLFDAPQEDYTRRLLAAVPRLGSSVRQSTDEPTVPPDTSPSPVLDLREIEVCFGSTTILKKVSLDIRPREVVGLVGESGSGKSTIARVLVGLVPLVGGSVTLLGTDLRAVRSRDLRALRRRVGFIFQDPSSSFNPYMTVAECIAEPISVHRHLRGEAAIRGRVKQLLDQVQLARRFADRYPHELSGGQRQRVGIARALALDPALVIADEATSALDVSVQAKVLETFQQLQRDLGFAALFISHDLAVVEQVSDRLGVLCKGELLEFGQTKDVLSGPSHEYTRQLIAAVPIPDPILQRKKRLADA